MSRDSGIRKDNTMNKKSLLTIIGLGAVSTTALVYNYLQWKSNKELEEQLDVLNEKIKELNNTLDKYTNVEIVEEVEEEQPKKSKVVPLYQPQVIETEQVERVEEVTNIVESINKQTEKRDEFLQQFESSIFYL